MDKEFWRAIFDRTSLVIIVSGAILLVLSASSGLTLGTFSLEIIDTSWRMLISITSILLIIFGIYLVFRETLHPSLNNDIKQFSTGDELMQYLNKRLQEARRHVDDLSWSPEAWVVRELRASNELHDEFMIRRKQTAQRIPYREVYAFNRSQRKERLKVMIELNCPTYSCSYYKRISTPVLAFIIIDDEVIVFANSLESKLAIYNPAIVRLYQDYYNEIWQESTKIKEGNLVHNDIVEQLIS